MPNYKIVEFSDGLRIRSWTSGKSQDGLPSMTLAASFIAGLAQYAELQITKFELSAYVPPRRRRRSPCTVVIQTADIRRFEFQPDPNLFSEERQGLCVVTRDRTITVLPFLGYSDTQEVIGKIEEKFPGLAEAWHSVEPFGKKDERSSLIHRLRGLF